MMQGMGYGSAVFPPSGGAPSVNGGAPASLGVGLSGMISGGGGGQQMALGLIVILGGLLVLYVSTRSIQGSVK